MDQALLVEALDQALEVHVKPCVVECDAPQQALGEVGVEHLGVQLLERLELGEHLGGLLLGQVALPAARQLAGVLLAGSAAVHEVQARQQIRLEPGDQLVVLGRLLALALLGRLASPPSVEVPAPLAALATEAARVVRRELPQIAGGHVPVGQGDAQRHGAPVLVDDGHLGVADRAEPVGELVEVGQGGGQTQDLHVRGQVDQHLLPHGAPLGVVEEVDLVDDHRGEVVQPLPHQQHVAQDLRGHDAQGGLVPDHLIAGDQAHLLLAERRHVVAVLLVAQRLDRRRVDHLAARLQPLLDDHVRHQRLARPRGRRHQHRMPSLQVVERVRLETVQLQSAVLHGCLRFRERVGGCELSGPGPGPAGPPRRARG